MFFLTFPTNNIFTKAIKNKFQELIHMEYKSVIKGAAVGLMAGSACYVISRSSNKKKKSLKRNTIKAAKAFSNAVSCFSSMMR